MFFFLYEYEIELIFVFLSLQVPLPFSTFLDFCKKRMQMQSKHQQGLDQCPASQTHDDTEHAYLALEDAPEQIYLAQVEHPTPMRLSIPL